MEAEIAELQLKLQQTEAAIQALEAEDKVAARLEQALGSLDGLDLGPLRWAGRAGRDRARGTGSGSRN